VVSDCNGERTVVGLLFGVMLCRVTRFSDGYEGVTVVGLLFDVIWCRVASV